MDALTSAVVGLKAAQTTSEIQYAVAAKMLQNTKTQGAAVLKLIEAAGEGFDQAAQNVSSAISSQLDLYA